MYALTSVYAINMLKAATIQTTLGIGLDSKVAALKW